MNPAYILLVEDHADLALGLRTSLEVEGYRVAVAVEGTEALERVREQAPDLIVLDLMLPGMHGFQVLRKLRSEGHEMPVLILSARGEEADKVQGFRLGADNYAVKPIGVLELLARIDAMLRRAQQRAGPAEPQRYQFGTVEVDVAARKVEKAGVQVELSPKEFDLLLYLLRRSGTVVSRSELLHQVWGYKRAVPTRTVDAHIALLRGKLEENPAQPRYLLTARKAGYRLDPSAATRWAQRPR
jgi:DNA-binding response OmpR family regulator